MPPTDPAHVALLRLCRLRLQEGDRQAVARIAALVDWDELARLARRGGLAGLVGRNLEGLAVPRAAVLELAKHALLAQAENDVLMEQARLLCDAAEREGLVLVPLKGAALNLLLYKDHGLRAMCDLDLWARRDQVTEVERLVAAQGYRAEARRGYALRHSHHLRHVREVGRRSVLLELHWTGLLGDFGSREEEARMLEGARLHPLDGGAVRMLAVEDLALVLVLHFLAHRYRAQLKWLVDLAELARAFPDLPWTALWQRLQRMGAARATALAVELARDLLDAPIPAPAGTSLLLPLLRRASPAGALVTSQPQASWAARALVDLLQYDSPVHGARSLWHKAEELAERYWGLRLTSRDRLA